VASVIVMNMRCVDGMITMECQPNRTRVTVRFRPVLEKKSIKDQRGWLMLNAARRQVIVASVRWCQHSPLSASPVRPNDLAQEPEFLSRSSVRNGDSGDWKPELHRGSTGPGAAAEVAAQKQHGQPDQTGSISGCSRESGGRRRRGRGAAERFG
jgi:hypothetical protein